MRWIQGLSIVLLLGFARCQCGERIESARGEIVVHFETGSEAHVGERLDLSFGAMSFGQQISKRLTLANRGTAALSVRSIEVLSGQVESAADSGGVFVLPLTEGLELPAGEARVIEAVFHPV